MKTSTRTRWSELGALTSAGTAAATVLCCLPFATGVIGASVAALGARFAQFQPYLIVVSVGLLTYAFYQAYRRDPACAADACDLPAAVRRRRLVLWVVTAMVVGLLTVTWWSSWLIYWTL